jgi:hypothetical protein
MVITEDVLKQIAWRIQIVPELSGCAVGFYGNLTCRTIGFPSCVTPNSENVAVIVEEVVGPERATASTNGVPVARASMHPLVTNRSRLGAELIGAGVSCALTAFSAVSVLGGVAAEVPTGGASSFLVIAGWSGLATGGIQCANGFVRVGAALADIDGNSLEVWDRNQVYSISILLVDALGVASAVGSLPYAVRNLWATMTRLRAFNAAKLSFDVLRRMNRLERLRAISQVFAEASRTNDGTSALVSAAREAQIGARSMQRTAGLSVKHAGTLARIIKAETVTRVHASLRDVFSNMAGLSASASPSSLTGNASGSVNWVINLLDGGQPIF